jgi:mono/diheme cytochrome c family protein
VQITKGRFEYSQRCAVCHGAQLEDGGAPAFKGKQYVAVASGYSGGSIPLSGSTTIVIFGL